MSITSYLLLAFGVIPLVLLVWFYFVYIHINRNRIRQTINQLSLPNKVGFISLVIAVVAFFYSIFYSSISTFYTLKALESADSAGVEQKASFKKQLDLMIAQQKTLEMARQSLDSSTRLAQRQVDNLRVSVDALNKMVETSTKQLSILDAQRNEQLVARQVRPRLELRYSVGWGKVGLTEKELSKSRVRLKPNEAGKFHVAIYVTNKGNAIARNLIMEGIALPQSVNLNVAGGDQDIQAHNKVTSIEYMNYVLPPGGFRLFDFYIQAPGSLNNITLVFKAGTDDPTVSGGFKADFFIDRSDMKVK